MAEMWKKDQLCLDVQKRLVALSEGVYMNFVDSAYYSMQTNTYMKIRLPQGFHP